MVPVLQLPASKPSCFKYIHSAYFGASRNYIKSTWGHLEHKERHGLYPSLRECPCCSPRCKRSSPSRSVPRIGAPHSDTGKQTALVSSLFCDPGLAPNMPVSAPWWGPFRTEGAAQEHGEFWPQLQGHGRCPAV